MLTRRAKREHHREASPAAAQQVVYARNDSKRRKHDLALFHRVFKARQHYFTEAFRRKVSDRYQWLTFLRKAGASAGG